MKRRLLTRLVRGLCLGCLLIGGPALAQTGRARHSRLFVVPRSAAVVVDGKLGDWDRSGEIGIYVVKQTSAMRSAKVALMYDAEALYIAGDVRDTTPLMNRHDPEADARNAWDADACQIRMVLDPAQGYPVTDSSKVNRRPNDQMVHMLLWYYTDRREPNLQLKYGMTYDLPKALYANGVVPLDKFEAAYRAADDKLGYTFEYRIPWATLEAKQPPKAGNMVAGIVQVLWSQPDGLETDGHSGWAYDVMAQAGFPWQSAACWGKFIFANAGNLPATLVAEGVEIEPPLPLTFTFKMPREAQASITLFNDRKEAVRILLAQAPRPAGQVVERWDGLDGAGQPFPAGSYTWRGAHFEPITTRFVMSVQNSGTPPYKTDDNTGGWGGDHGVPTAAAVAGDGLLLAWDVAEAGWGIIRTDRQGKKRWGNKFSAEFLASDGRRGFMAGDQGFETHAGVRVIDLADGRPVAFTKTGTITELPGDGNVASNRVTGLAYHGGKLFTALAGRDLVAINDATTGELLAAWPVPAPGWLATATNGTLLAVSGGKLVAVNDGKVSAFIHDHLDQPGGIAVDQAGNVYVANRGRLQNVSVFTAAGKYLKSIGKQGGRPRAGLFAADGMLEPGGIAVDAQGKLWVPETIDSPKRISVWDTLTGKLLDEFYGGAAYAAYVAMDPKHADEVLCHNTIWKIDLDKGAWRPHATIWRSRGGDSIGDPRAGGYVGHMRLMTAANGRQFAWGGVNYGNILFMRAGDVFKPIAGLINVLRTPRFEAVIPPALADAKKFPRGYYFWQDLNDDQAVQANEIVGAPLDNGTKGFNWIDADLNAWCEQGFVLRPERFEGGRPIYDLNKREPTPFKGNNGGFTSLWVDPQDQSVYLLNPGAEPGLGRWTKDGKLLWSYRGVVHWQKAINLPPVQPGKLWGPTMPLGVAGDFTGMATYFGPFHLMTRDGLYVAMVFRDLRMGGLTPDTLTAEAFSGELVKPAGMNRYFLLGGDQDGRISEVLGLDSVARLDGGSVTISAADAALVAAERMAYEQKLAAGQSLVLGRGRPSLDGAKRVSKAVDHDRKFAVAAAYDEQNLYVAFDVTSPSPLVTAITDPKLLFKGGNALDIQVAADVAADPNRKTPAPGDARLLISRQAGKTVAALYRPVVDGYKGAKIVLTSPTGRESFDRIEEVGAAVDLVYEPRDNGFRAIAAIPLALLNLKPAAGTGLRMDLGYIFGNKTGTQAAVRSYWRNNSFSANVINDIPNESRLEPAEWGTVIVE